MNNFNPTNLQQQQQQQHVANVLQTPTTATAISYLQQQQQQQQPKLLQQQQQQQLSHQLNTHAPQLAAAAAAVYDPRALEKTYYTTATGAATVAANAAPAAGGGFFTTATGAAGNTATHAPNTILITNNFAQQQLSAVHQQQQQQQQQRAVNFSNNNNNNIRIASSTPQRLHQHVAATQQQLQQQQQQHVYNISNMNNNILAGKDLTLNQLQATADSLQLQQLHQQQQHQFYQQHYAQQQLLPQHAAAAQYAAAQHFAALQLPPATLAAAAAAQQYFMPDAAAAAAAAAAVATTTNTAKLLPNTLAIAPTTTTTLSGGVGGQNEPNSAAPNSNSSSTVVLDRINICINNHYTDVSAASTGLRISSPVATQQQQQQPSPIIPAIQHKGIIDAATGLGLLIDPYANNNSTSSSNESTQLVIDEPDSTTTTPNTPPTTPETLSSPTTDAATVAQSCLIKTVESPTAFSKHSFAAIAANTIEKKEKKAAAAELEHVQHASALKSTSDGLPLTLPTTLKAQQDPLLPFAVTNATQSAPPDSAAASVVAAAMPLTPPTPPTPPAAPTAATAAFSIGDDVFVKRQDGRLYLGTVIYSACQQFLVRFDDKSEVWCNTAEMRKLGGGGGGGGSSSGAGGNGNAAVAAVVDSGPQCVACKRRSTLANDAVEICERCGRGYHRLCTVETAPGSGVWQCKRCAKPMKVLKTSNIYTCEEPKVDFVCRQLPYHVDTLNWDEKHRVNEEQIYCYCGKSGKFNHNMLQCCKCRNWYHTHCMQHFKSKILRGDGFFVFCCSVCNDGAEFLRRLQLNWVDLMHLTLYNLSAMKKHQHHKYHHLVKDIWPFVLEKRSTLPICKEWIDMPEAEFMESIKNTLKHNTERFICGREIKRDHYYYALRNNGPPILPKFHVQKADVLSDAWLSDKLKLNLLKGAPENESLKPAAIDKKAASYNAPKSKPPEDDVYEFRIEDDEKFTSDDEIPIKHILEKVKRSKTTPTTKTTTTDKAAAAAIITKTKPQAITTTANDKMEIDDENANDANCSFAATSSCSNIANNTLIKKSEMKSASSSPSSSVSASSASTDATKIATEKQAQTHDATLDTALDNFVTAPEAAAAATETETTATIITPIAKKSSRKRKAFTLSSYKEIASEAAAKRYDGGACNRICDHSSSDENSSSSRGTSLDLIIPPPKNFLGLNNPFLMVTPKKSTAAAADSGKKSVSFSRKGAGRGGGGTYVKNSIFNTSTLDFSSKLAALKSAGMFPNLSTSNLAKAAGQPRTVRTIKRRLSAKDIMIGPNQEVRRRRTRRLSSNIEVISTTTINPIPSNFFPIHAKDLFNTSTTTTNQHKLHQHHHHQQQQQNNQNQLPPIFSSATPPSFSSASSSPPASTTSSLDSSLSTTSATAAPTAAAALEPAKPTHGRRLRQRPQKNSPSNSRRSSISGASTSSNQSMTKGSATVAAAAAERAALQAAAAKAVTQGTILLDLKQSVNKYFGAANRIESGEQFAIRAKRQLANGQVQYLIEWGETTAAPAASASAATTTATTTTSTTTTTD